MEKVEIQITKGLTEETTEEITLLGHILENADGLKVFSELIKSCDFRECRIYSFRKEEAASYFTSGGR